jgi:16S rRNA C967 or C1407 C5-methylase (RsmB/RsmF family)
MTELAVFVYTEAMTVTLELSEDALGRLRAEAERRGVSLNVLINELASRLPTKTSSKRGHKLRIVGLGASTSGRTASEADEMLAEGFGLS